MIELSGAAVRLGGRSIFSNVELHVGTGQLVAVFNGALKGREIPSLCAVFSRYDGDPVAEVTTDVEPDVVAALAAATSSVGLQFSQILALGNATGTVIQATDGCAAVYPIGTTAMLVLYCTDSTHVARLHLAVRQMLPRITAVMAA